MPLTSSLPHGLLQDVAKAVVEARKSEDWAADSALLLRLLEPGAAAVVLQHLSDCS